MSISHLVISLALTVAAIAVAFVLSARLERKPRDHLCQIAEISPDMTVAEKERCRMLRMLRMYKEGKTL